MEDNTQSGNPGQKKSESLPTEMSLLLLAIRVGAAYQPCSTCECQHHAVVAMCPKVPVVLVSHIGEAEVLSILSFSYTNAQNTSEVQAQSGSVSISLAFLLFKVF